MSERKRVEIWEGQKDMMFAILAKGRLRGAGPGKTSSVLMERNQRDWEHPDRLEYLGDAIHRMYGAMVELQQADNPPEIEGYHPRALTDPLHRIQEAYEGAILHNLEAQGHEF